MHLQSFMLRTIKTMNLTTIHMKSKSKIEENLNDFIFLKKKGK